MRGTRIQTPQYFTPQIRRSSQHRPRGLTLLELVVVLGILAILAGVTIQSLEPMADQARYDATLRTLEAVDRAIYQEQQVAPDRVLQRGFLADMGRLPIANGNDPASHAVELWDRLATDPALPPYSITNFADPENSGLQVVRIAAGWNGPYIQRPANNRLLDGWGNSFNYSPLGGLLSPGQAITTIRSFGADRVLDGLAGSGSSIYASDLTAPSQAFDAHLFAEITFNLMPQSDGSGGSVLGPGERLFLFVYGPANGVATRLYPPPGTSFNPNIHSSVTAQLVVPIDMSNTNQNLTVGPRTILAVTGIGDSPSNLVIGWQQSRAVQLFPGNNVITMHKPPFSPGAGTGPST